MEKLAVDIGSSFDSPIGRGVGVGSIVSTFISLAITISGIILLFLLVGGGVGMIAGAGSDNPERMQKGKQAVTAAAIGFIVVFAAYWIVRLIEVLTGSTFVTAPVFN